MKNRKTRRKTKKITLTISCSGKEKQKKVKKNHLDVWGGGGDEAKMKPKTSMMKKGQPERRKERVSFEAK